LNPALCAIAHHYHTYAYAYASTDDIAHKAKYIFISLFSYSGVV